MLSKEKRIDDPKAISAIRKEAGGFCEYCGASHSSLQVHHIKTEGSGGGDVRDNLIALCWICHTKAHHANILKAELRKIVKKREGRRRGKLSKADGLFL